MKRSFVIAIVIAMATFAVAKDQVTSRQENRSGMIATTFQTPQGSVKVYAPSSGSTFSGKVVTEPAGRTAEERRKNGAMLNGYTVAVNGQKSSVASSVVRYAAPAAGGGIATLALLDSSGHSMSSASLWQTPAAPVALPSVVQTGAPFPVPGNFTPDVSTNQVQVGGAPANQLVMTPGAAIVSTGAVGPATVTGGGSTGEVRAVAVDLSAPTNTLHSGQQAPVTLTLSGLHGLSAPVSVTLTNQCPENMNLSGGNQQTFQVNPSDVQPGGVFTTTRTMTGVAPGAFSVTAEVEDQILCTTCTDCDKLRQRANELDGKADELDAMADAADAAADKLDKSADDHKAKAEAHDKKAGKYEAHGDKTSAAQERTMAANQRAAEKEDRDAAQAKRDEAKQDRADAKAARDEAAKLRKQADDCDKKNGKN